MIAALGLILVLGIVTTAATRRYIREQAGSERSLTVGPETMYCLLYTSCVRVRFQVHFLIMP